MKTGARIIVDILEQQGITTVFGYPGAANAPLYEELSKSGITHILPRGEQAAAHAAGAFARVKGGVGVCMATSGPGATNLITGIANAYMDSVPLVAITGQVTTDKIGQDVFQEADITGATAPFCKHNYLVKDIHMLPEILNQAFYIAGTGRPGPVLVDIPIDIQMQTTEYHGDTAVDIKGYKPTYKGNGGQIKRAAAAIAESQKPVILAGGGILISDAKAELLEFSDKINAPVITTLMGIASFPADHPRYFGMVGSHGFASANYAMLNTDLLIVLGARAADRAIGVLGDRSDIKVIHVDIDPAEIGKILNTFIPIVGNLKTVIGQLTAKTAPREDNGWLDTLNGRRKPEARETDNNGFVNPKYALRLLSEMAPEDAIVSTEVGQNQIWTARCWKFGRKHTFLTSGGLGTMGYGLPAAVGAKIAAKDRTVIAVEGDGSFQMSMAELATIMAYQLDVKIVLLKNNRLGMVNELQHIRKYNRFAVFLDGSPDFCALAAAYGIPSARTEKNSALKEEFDKMLHHSGPYLLELSVHPDESTMGG